MRNPKRVLRSLACALALLANGAVSVPAQQQQRQRERQPAPPAERDVLVERDKIMIAPSASETIGSAQGSIVFGNPGDVSTMSFSWVSSEMAFDSRVVKGAPFTAEAVTESNQTLADGNRITRKTTSTLYRDGEGRTRRDQTITAAGPFATAQDSHRTVFINDPVSGDNYVLSPDTNIASKAPQHFTFRRGEGLAPAKQGETIVLRTEGQGTRQLDTTRPILGGALDGRAKTRVQPVYPAIARAASAEGRVTVEIVVNEEGRVESARALDGHPLLRQSAVDAARQWEFAPTRLSGNPVKVTGKLSFSFSLSRHESSAGMSEPPPPPPPGEPPPPRAGMMRVPGVEQYKAQTRFEETREALGRQSIEGVEAEGTRTTVTIPAGAIGNERAIQITSERWYSPELQMVVMTKHSDPRFGETTYRLTNVTRAEPDHSLFEVPAGYKIITHNLFERQPAPQPMRRKIEQ